ncbi:MAG: uracil phosphoribosyltransferase [Candidatus Dormibacteria bacterium]
MPAWPQVVEHPTVAHRLSELRHRSTGHDRFRQLVEEITTFLAYEALRDLGTSPQRVPTPVGVAQGRRVSERLVVVPVLRAGLGMVPGVARVAPECEVAHLGMRRDERTLAADCYLDGLPADLSGRRVLVCDPMLATGGSLVSACSLVLSRHPAGLAALCLVASQPGLDHLRDRLGQIPVVCAAVDPRLDRHGFIVPGLGDAGDRLFGPPASRRGA